MIEWLQRNTRAEGEPEKPNREALLKMWPDWPGPNPSFWRQVMRGLKITACGDVSCNECSGSIP